MSAIQLEEVSNLSQNECDSTQRGIGFESKRVRFNMKGYRKEFEKYKSCFLTATI